MSSLAGGCHCGANRFTLETAEPLAPRACQCGFCRRHNARSVSDPAGRATLSLAGNLIRYRFASGSADYLICADCGVYLGALANLEGGLRLTLNLNAFDEPRLELEAEPVDYDGESAAGKADRRRVRWTPAFLA